MVWPTVQRPTETKRWAVVSVIAAVPRNMKFRSAGPKWTQLWVRTTGRLAARYQQYINANLFY